jgi:SAM-dependent methyltransferase
MNTHDPEDLQRIYETRFRNAARYRQAVWSVLISDYFQRFIGPTDRVLDLGCGYGEFINQIRCGQKYGMDLNPDAARQLQPDIKFFLQDCSTTWPLGDNSLDLVFTSNFFEHLPDKTSLGRTLDEIHRCLKPGGRLIALGPNFAHLAGMYWDFWDHHLPLTEKSLGEALRTRKFELEQSIGKFLPYTMAGGPQYPLIFLRLYLRMSFVWHMFGRQFLVVTRKPFP